MRHFLTGLVVAATTTLLPALALADNQEIAERIGRNLRNSGQVQNYRIGVKYEQGTAWMVGQVSNQQQMNSALNVVSQTPEVTRVVNNLVIRSAAPVKISGPRTPTKSQTEARPAKQIQTSTTLQFGDVKNTLRRTLKKLDPEPFRRALWSGQKMPRPRKGSAVGRLETVIANAARNKKMRRRSTSANDQTSPGVQWVASSFTPASAELVAATQPALQHMKGQRIARRPIPIAYIQQPGAAMPGARAPGSPIPAYVSGVGGGVAPARYDQPHMPNYAWPSYAAYPNYASLTYPRQHSPTVWPFIGPFYPYPQVPLGWRKVTLEWDDGWWMLDFKD